MALMGARKGAWVALGLLLVFGAGYLAGRYGCEPQVPDRETLEALERRGFTFARVTPRPRTEEPGRTLVRVRGAVDFGERPPSVAPVSLGTPDVPPPMLTQGGPCAGLWDLRGGCDTEVKEGGLVRTTWWAELRGLGSCEGVRREELLPLAPVPGSGLPAPVAEIAPVLVAPRVRRLDGLLLGGFARRGGVGGVTVGVQGDLSRNVGWFGQGDWVLAGASGLDGVRGGVRVHW